MKLLRHSPERALRIQAGVKPLHKGRSYTSPEGAAEDSVTPSGLIFIAPNSRGSISFHPCLCSVRPFRAKNVD